MSHLTVIYNDCDQCNDKYDPYESSAEDYERFCSNECQKSFEIELAECEIFAAQSD